MTLVAFDPVIAAMLLLAGGLYVRALRVLRRRHLRVSSWQQTAWWIGVALLTILAVFTISLGARTFSRAAS